MTEKKSESQMWYSHRYETSGSYEGYRHTRSHHKIIIGEKDAILKSIPEAKEYTPHKLIKKDMLDEELKDIQKKISELKKKENELQVKIDSCPESPYLQPFYLAVDDYTRKQEVILSDDRDAAMLQYRRLKLAEEYQRIVEYTPQLITQETLEKERKQKEEEQLKIDAEKKQEAEKEKSKLLKRLKELESN